MVDINEQRDLESSNDRGREHQPRIIVTQYLPECPGWYDAYCSRCGESSTRSMVSRSEAAMWRCGGP